MSWKYTLFPNKSHRYIPIYLSEITTSFISYCIWPRKVLDSRRKDNFVTSLTLPLGVWNHCSWFLRLYWVIQLSKHEIYSQMGLSFENKYKKNKPFGQNSLKSSCFQKTDRAGPSSLLWSNDDPVFSYRWGEISLGGCDLKGKKRQNLKQEFGETPTILFYRLFYGDKVIYDDSTLNKMKNKIFL